MLSYTYICNSPGSIAYFKCVTEFSAVLQWLLTSTRGETQARLRRGSGETQAKLRRDSGETEARD